MTPRYVAVVGVGSSGYQHLQALRGIEGIVPIAVSRRPERIRELNDAGFTTASDIHRAVQAGAAFSIVATETAHHSEHARSAMNAGCAVLVEKPLALDAKEARDIVDHAAKLGMRLHVGCLLRFAESLQTFRESLPLLGNIHSVRIECQTYLPDWRSNRPYQESYSSQVEGGALRDLIHEIDYAGWIFGWPSEVQAILKNRGRLNIASEESVDLMWEISGGPTVSMTIDYLSRPPRRVMTAFGENGSLEWNGITGETTEWIVGVDPRKMQSSEKAAQFLQKQDSCFVAGLLDSRLATAEDGVKALAICDAARRASQIGRTEKVIYL